MNLINEKLLTIRYEDFISSPNRELKKILKYCDLDTFSFSTEQLLKNQNKKNLKMSNSKLDKYIKEKATKVLRDYKYL